MNRNVLNFLRTESAERVSLYIDKANRLEGDVTLLAPSSQDLEDIKNAMFSNPNLELKVARLDVMKKIAYASTRNHYLTGATIFGDISKGTYNCDPKSYV
ncbi:TPA: hypothetical protein ACL2SJ_000413 [Streptococcus pneumoniae]|uniref:Uncharacterized protein n=3 Tax=Streptococcus pneumoniae TaxID=1313 RepID=A0A7X2XJD6_STREE|nr:hypothetical protein [Streptococcus pneumoniae]ELU55927.1 hypothetical protein PCS8203_01613 [Streptococcus pneumoniae PCS8203]ELU57658.1 hypothetical protein PCS8106_01206 [Streptococcus pneumoniae PCS8106]OYK99324.1 hypothetical protein AK82_11730 [Streptococcus pneumoniae K2521]ACO19792.1 conserved hypothetical protein [Streptococcus pneumoniae JJA]EHZ57157.1 hypothetical protein SPAR89_1594 [Streptococcus pneumoniae GA47210]